MNLITRLRALVRGEEGQDLLEYALLVALIALVCVVAVTSTGTAVSTIFIGSVGGVIWQKRSPNTAADYMVPLASGLIAGEALIAVIVAGLVPLLSWLHVSLPLIG